MKRPMFSAVPLIILAAAACLAEPVDPTPAPCAEGAAESRNRYAAADVPFGEACQVEEQTRICEDSAWSAWSGSFAEAACTEALPPACGDADGDGYGAGCELGNDCDDTDVTCRDACGAFGLDADGDGYAALGAEVLVRCAAPAGTAPIDREDCDDTDGRHIADCATCRETDDDGYGAGCELGNDCDDTDVTCRDACGAFGLDADGDGYAAQGAEVLVRCAAPAGTAPIDREDCDDTDGRHIADCATCRETDDDGYGAGCELGNDCDDTDVTCRDACGAFGRDGDGDGYAAQGAEVLVRCAAPAGTAPIDREDCDDTDGRHIADCATCRDTDDDGYGAGCELGNDCDDANVELFPGSGDACPLACATDEWSRTTLADHADPPTTLVFDGDGGLHAVSGSGDRHFYLAPAGDSRWVADRLPRSPVPHTSTQFSDFAVDAGGGLHEVATINGGGLRYAHRPAGRSTWQNELFDADVDGLTQAAIAVDAAGGVHLVYDDGDTVRYAVRPAGDTEWQISELWPDSAMVGPDLAIDAEGGIHAVYYGGVLRYAYRAPGADSWEVSVANFGFASGPSMALDRAGGVHIAYRTESSASPNEVTYAYRAPGSDRWEHSEIPRGGQAPSVAVGDDGIAHVAFYSSADGDLVYARRAAPGTDWELAVLDGDGDVGTGPSVALDAAGRVHVTYTNRDSNRFLYYLQRCR